jgi:hypothetical protein
VFEDGDAYGKVSFRMLYVRTCNGLLHTINSLAENLTVSEVTLKEYCYDSCNYYYMRNAARALEMKFCYLWRAEL